MQQRDDVPEPNPKSHSRVIVAGSNFSGFISARGECRFCDLWPSTSATFTNRETYASRKKWFWKNTHSNRDGVRVCRKQEEMIRKKLYFIQNINWLPFNSVFIWAFNQRCSIWSLPIEIILTSEKLKSGAINCTQTKCFLIKPDFLKYREVFNAMKLKYDTAIEVIWW